MSIYLDHNASSPLRADVKDAMIEAMDWIGNPSSTHRYGREARQKIEDVRTSIGEYFKTSPSQVIFTSGATEANNTLIQGFKGRVIISSVEHDSVAHANDRAQVCPVDGNGIIDLKLLETLLEQSEGPTLVSVMAANNETGGIQPLESIVELTRKYKAYVHSDAVQAVGRLNMDWLRLDLDAITFSTHKVGGPQGVGGYVVKPTLPFIVPFRGGGQERSYRPGTENKVGLIGMGALFARLESRDWDPIAQLRDRLEAEIAQICPATVIFARSVKRLPNTTNLTMPEVKSETQVMSFDLRGIAVSAGSACSSGKVKESRVLHAMGIPQCDSQTALRVSLGQNTTEAEISAFVAAWKDIYEYTRSRTAL